ncbi:MAG TPA: MFS transporter [Actinospica sp.]|jgi:MFS family permease|nr:MFS transporter [Actinospica sp.]
MTEGDRTAPSRGALQRWNDEYSRMGGFYLIWVGQLASLLGTTMAQFAFVIHSWASGGHATTVVGLLLAGFLPRMLLSPLAGTLVDRWPKKTVLQLSDLGGMLALGALAAVYFLGHLAIWQIYVALALAGVAEAFQYPAFSAAVPLLVPRDGLQRANGLMATAQSITSIGGPVFAGVLIATGGLGSILVLDVVSYAIAVLTIVAIPIRDAVTAEKAEKTEKSSLWGETGAGLRYILTTPSLRSLTGVILVANISAVFGFAVLAPMILARSDNDEAAWAIVSVCTGIGGVVGGLLMSLLKAPRSRMRVLLLGTAGVGLIGQVAMGAGRDLPAWCAAELVCAALLPIVNAMETIQMQAKVPAALQGRVFGASIFLSQCVAPLVFLVSGPLADHVFEPQAASGTGIVGLLAPLIGHGRGTGMAAMLFLAGLMTFVVGLAGLAVPSLRDIDTLMPDLPEERAQEPAAEPMVPLGGHE